MMLVRTHYVIDMVTGLIFSHYMFIWAEKVTFVVDVLLMKIPGKKRGRRNFKPCKHCGWSNKYAGDYMEEAERERLKEIHKDQYNLLLESN